MLQTIEVEIDARGCIHPLEPLPFEPVGRALLTLLQSDKAIAPAQQEVQQRIAALRNDWRN